MVVPKRRWIVRRSSCALRADDRIERAERLVHQQKRGLRRERPRDADPLLLAARQLVRVLGRRTRRVELEQLEQFVDADASIRLCPSRAGAAR